MIAPGMTRKQFFPLYQPQKYCFLTLLELSEVNYQLVLKKSNKFGFFHLFLSDYLNPGDGNACAGQDMAKGVPNATLVFDFITSGNFGEVPVMGSNLKIHYIFEIDSYL